MNIGIPDNPGQHRREFQKDSTRHAGCATNRATMKNISPVRVLSIILFAFIFCAVANGAEVLSGKIVGIADGDTVTVLTPEKLQVKIRLEGIDAPEAGQEYGQNSKQALSALIFGKEVTVRQSGTDRYGRTLGWISAFGTDVNREMVRLGWAWHFNQYNQEKDIAALQADAKAAKRGLWAAPNAPMPPWEYRALGRKTDTPSPIPIPTPTERRVTPTPVEKPATGAGKYWINSNGVRHNGRCRWFGNTKRGHYSNEAEGRGCGICGG